MADDYPNHDCGHRAEEEALRYGAKIVGGWIGTDAYVKNCLRHQLTELESIAEKLMQLPNLQIRMLLFRLCFRPKVHFLFRTYEHLSQLMGEGSEQSPEETRFGNLLANIISLVANGEIPEAILPAF